jgi:dATP pyrophosphohydrolase
VPKTPKLRELSTFTERLPVNSVPPLYKIPESVLVVIHTRQRQVLVIERVDQAGFWQSVTGSRDTPHEALMQTALREVFEETGITASPVQWSDWGVENVYEIYPGWRHRYAPDVTHNTEHVFGLCLPAPCAVTLNPHEHTASLWLPYREAADVCFSPSNAEAILLLPRLTP